MPVRGTAHDAVDAASVRQLMYGYMVVRWAGTGHPGERSCKPLYRIRK